MQLQRAPLSSPSTACTPPSGQHASPIGRPFVRYGRVDWLSCSKSPGKFHCTAGRYPKSNATGFSRKSNFCNEGQRSASTASSSTSRRSFSTSSRTLNDGMFSASLKEEMPADSALMDRSEAHAARADQIPATVLKSTKLRSMEINFGKRQESPSNDVSGLLAREMCRNHIAGRDPKCRSKFPDASRAMATFVKAGPTCKHCSSASFAVK
mmetsp:Transcript_118364/g.330132  ORF Transcript_118364/g.330132 Transcript_118364/m.330132 type:complete len:210 (-) Transcript_118364:27-656(-)